MAKLDLQVAGAVGFQPYWLRRQGYRGRNLLQLLVDSCLDKGIDLCAITSEEWEIPKGSVHDRFGHLAEEYAHELPPDYKFEMLDSNLFVVEKSSRRVYAANSQTVKVKEKINGESKVLGHLVIGSNQVPNSMNLRDTIQYGKDHGLIQIPKNPLLWVRFGMGQQRLEEHLGDYDALMHDSQLAFPSFAGHLPIIGQFSGRTNQRTKEFALSNGVPYIACSNAKTFDEVGRSYIQTSQPIYAANNGELLSSLKEVIASSSFKTSERYTPLTKVANWFGSLYWAALTKKS